MPYVWQEPELVVEHQGVSVYHVYQNDFGDQGAYEYHYTTDISEQASFFDIRDLMQYDINTDHIETLVRGDEFE